MNATAYERFTSALDSHGRSVKHNGNDKAMAQCPAHNDSTASLSINPRRNEGKGIVIKCQAGCRTTETGLRAVNLQRC